MNCNAFCGYQSIPFHCFLPSGAELELGRETRERKGGRWVRLMGMYSSIKTTVKVVVTTEQRGDSSDQELLVSSTLLSGEDRARVSCAALRYTWQCSLFLCQNNNIVVIGNHISACGSGFSFFFSSSWSWWVVSAAVRKILPAVTTPLPRMERKHTVRIAFPAEWLCRFHHNVCCVHQRACFYLPDIFSHIHYIFMAGYNHTPATFPPLFSS